jgi:hypothetical protein
MLHDDSSCQVVKKITQIFEIQRPEIAKTAVSPHFLANAAVLLAANFILTGIANLILLSDL